MAHNSKRAWVTIKLNPDEAPPSRVGAVTPNQVAHQLLLNGKPINKERGHKKIMKMDIISILQSNNVDFEPFTEEDLATAISHLKHDKASGIDGITTEMVTHLEPNAKCWLMSLVNNCASSRKIPKIGRELE